MDARPSPLKRGARRRHTGREGARSAAASGDSAGVMRAPLPPPPPPPTCTQVGESTAELEALRQQTKLETRRAEEFRSAVLGAEGDRQLLEEQVASLGREAADAAAARERWANLDAAARAEAETEVSKAKEQIIALEVRLRQLNEELKVSSESVEETSEHLDSVRHARERELARLTELERRVAGERAEARPVSEARR